ncbi:MAG: hypothetical protein KME06_09890 [Kastovskya adunca ATA6-11-RM4]|jgi:hypothetical protein|nr:hypothetical protein [Kastovskya adunca ATA6-11-RM4]
MHTREKIAIVKTSYPQPNQVLMIFLIILGSFAVGLMPIIYGIGGQETQGVIPSEAALWSVFGERESW